MISDEMLERLLRDAAATFPPPVAGPQHVLAAARPPRSLRKGPVGAAALRRRRVQLVAAAVLIMVSAIGGVLLADSQDSRPLQPSATGASQRAAAGRAGAGEAWAPAPAPAGPTGRLATDARSSAQSRPGSLGPLPVGAPPRAATVPAPDGARIVKTGTVALEVARKRVGPTLDRLTSLAAAQGGYVATSSTAEGSSKPAGSVRLRVPARSFEDTLTQVRGYGTVQSVSSAGRDVTAAYVDLAARLRALQATRSTYLTLLSKARTIGETLAVQQQVDGVQQQIESLEGQRRVLADSSDLATLDVRVAEKGAAVAVVSPRQTSGLERAFARAFHGFARGVYAIIAASGPALLLLICLLVVLAISWFGYRTLRRRLV